MKIYINENFITDDSREVCENCWFLKTNTNLNYVPVALENGAKVIEVASAMKLLNISPNIKIIGITGTNGKTTTATAIASILQSLGHNVALAGTRGSFINGKTIQEKTLTTTPILETLKLLSEATLQKCDFLVMEVSSHAIVQNRIDGLNFALKIFTNLSQDHLDYHKNMTEYVKAKSSFFQDECMKLINIDDKNIKFNHKNAFTYSIKNKADFYPLAFGLAGGIDAIINILGKHEIIVGSDLQGEFNLYNLIAALGAVWLLIKPNIDDLSNAISEFKGVSGRMQVVSQNPLVIVDFAHTPDGIEKVLTSLRHLPIVSVFGAGGDRDKSKRPLMGKIAQQNSLKCIITSDNPRSENPNDIINNIVSGMDNKKQYYIEPDRKKAIELGLSLLPENGALVILGKGDEEYQEICGKKYKFSDINVVLEILKGKK